MHIVYVSREYIPSPRRGGIGSYVNEMASYISKLDGYKVTVICASNDTNVYKEEIIDGINVIQLDGGDFFIPSIEKSKLGKLSAIKKLRNVYRFYSYRRKVKKTVLKLKNIDVIEVPEYGAEGLYLMDLDIPISIRLHTPTFHDRTTLKKRKFKLSKFYLYFIQQYEEAVLLKAKHITSCSDNLKSWMIDNVKGIIPDIEVIYNPVNTERWTNLLNESKISNITLKNQIFYAGTINEEKGVGDLLDACKIIRETKSININLLLAGKDVYDKSKRIESYRNENWCHFLGNISQKELAGYYQSSEMSIFPSWWENMPLVCMEAMFLSGIVIGSNQGGMVEIITNGEDGFLINPRNPSELAKCMIHILELTTDEKNKIKEIAHEKVIRKFSAQTIISQMISYYKYIVQ